MKKHKFLLIIFLSVSAFVVGSDKLFTTLDILRPAKVTFPVSADKILIINNSAIQPLEYGHKTELLNDKTKNTRITTDSLSVFCVSALAEELSDKYFFNSVVLHQNSVNNNNFYFTLQPLSADTIQVLCKKYNVNIVLSLDRIKVNDKISEYYLGNSSSIEKPYVSNLELKFETIWSIHFPPENPVANSFVLRDTLYWENESTVKRLIQSGLPNRNDALIDGALYTGRNAVKKLVPWWDKVDRYFFTSNSPKMKEAIDSVYVKNWVAAINIWENFYNTTNNNSLKAKAANNLAVCYEIKNDLEKALVYANSAMKLFSELTFADYTSFIQVSEYAQQLRKRQEEIKTIKNQLGE